MSGPPNSPAAPPRPYVKRCRRLASTVAMLVVETGGRAEYEPTRAFYARRGYQVAATVPDYYEPGDDLVVFVKRLC